MNFLQQNLLHLDGIDAHAARPGFQVDVDIDVLVAIPHQREVDRSIDHLRQLHLAKAVAGLIDAGINQIGQIQCDPIGDGSISMRS